MEGCVSAITKEAPRFRPKEQDPLDETPMKKEYSNAWAFETLDGLAQCDPVVIKVCRRYVQCVRVCKYKYCSFSINACCLIGVVQINRDDFGSNLVA